jgi:hypothetical protein
LKLRFPLIVLSALAAFAVLAGSAFASGGATFIRPTDGANISQNQTLSVDTSNVPAAVGVDFYLDNAGTPGMYIGGYSAYADNPQSPQGANYSSNGNVDSYQWGIGGWEDGPYTIDAVLVDNVGASLATLTRNVTINNSLTPLVRGSFLPSASGTLSGTFTLSLTPSDQNNAITDGSFSVNDDNSYPLTSDGNGHWSASVNTVALGIPNGALDIEVRLNDAAGNTSDSDIFYTIGNPQAPTITPGTLVAEKSNWRTDETQLEVGDSVDAYNMRADGYPVPTVHYLWNVCRGQVCTGTTPGQDGSYTVQAADEGADLTLVATASNGVSPGAFTLVDFGVIAPAYVAPVDSEGGGFGDAPQSDPTPAPTPAPPVVTPPVVTPPVVTPPVVTPAEQTAINAAQKVVQTKAAAVVTAQKAAKSAGRMVKAAEKKVTAAVNTASAGTATPVAKQQLVSTVAALVSAKQVAAKKLARVKTVAVKDTASMNVAAKTVKTAQVNVVAAQTAVSTGAATPTERKRLTKTRQTLVAAQAVASTKTTGVAIATKQVVVTQTTAAKSISVAQKNVATAVTAVASSTATPTTKKTLIAVETKLVTAQAVASVTTDSLRTATTQLVRANQKLALKKAAALRP